MRGYMGNYPIYGNAQSQIAARLALPILVRQAEAGEPITYKDLGREIGMHHRAFAYPLGAIGSTLFELSDEWKEAIPQIQAIVISKTKGVPGPGIEQFLGYDYKSIPRSRQRELIKVELQRIFLYPHWGRVLKALGLEKTRFDYTEINKGASDLSRGEGERHRRLKNYVAKNPWVLGKPGPKIQGDTEVGLPSGDSLDVSFREEKWWFAAEVKGAGSPVLDIARGIYQCVKYAAVMRAVRASEQKERNVRVVLVLEGALPSDLVDLKNVLGIEVIENVTP